MTTPGLAVGLLADTKQQLSELNRLVLSAGHRVVSSREHQPGLIKQLPPADVWLVQLDVDCTAAQQLLSDLDDAGIPVIFADEDAPVPSGGRDPNLLPEALRRERVRRLALKLGQLVSPTDVGESRRRAEFVWVLGASTGGPEAIVAFLDEIPEPPAGVALLYAQHIDPRGLAHLTSMVQQHSRWRLQNPNSSQAIQEKSIYILSPEFTLDILQPGVIAPSNAPWSGCYKPSINQVIAKVARVYGAKGGAIVFSGMGDDGAKSCQLLHHLGGQVWVQSLASCALDSMPKSVTALGCVQHNGTPQQLARQLMAFHKTTAGPKPLRNALK